MKYDLRLIIPVLCCVLGSTLGVQASPHSLLSQNTGFAARGSLLPSPENSADRSTRASLFAGTQKETFFAPIAPRATPSISGDAPLSAGTAGLRDIIARAEAGSAGYDAVVYSAKIKPPKSPTRMTIREINTWVKETPNQNHAIGRYQFIPSTFRRLIKELGVSQKAVFSPLLQDRMADILLEDAGLSRFLAGDLPGGTFMDNLAKIWAGLPTASGRSYYHGYAGNKATLSRSRFEQAMSQIFAAQYGG